MNDVKDYIQAQIEYCKENNMPMFAPLDGRCFRCGRNIFENMTLEKARQVHITGCSSCHQSFCD